MDDLSKEIYKTWELRLKLEDLKKRLKVIIARLDDSEYLERHGQAAYEATLKEVQELKAEQYKLEDTQEKLERKTGLENPFLKN